MMNIHNDKSDLDYDIIDFCVKKKFERDKKVYKKPRDKFFDDEKLKDKQNEIDAKELEKDIKFWRETKKFK